MVRPGPLALAIAVAAGVAVGLRWGWPAALPAAAAGVLWLRGRSRAVLAIGFAIGAGRGAMTDDGGVPGAVVGDRAVDRVEGVVRGPVAHGPRGDGARLETAGETVWLWAPRLVTGERVAATGTLHAPRGLRDPGVPDRADAVRARGATLELTARTLERLGDDAGVIDLAWRWADAAQARWVAAIRDAGGDAEGAAALRGIVAGDRGEVSPALDQRWRTTGIFHVLSVSGLHLAVVAGLLFWLLRKLVAASPLGGRTRPARWAAPPALVFAIAYTMITGAQLATLRALVVIALVLLAQMLDRPLRLVDAIGAAAIALLVWRPADLLDPSFQLSFTAGLTLALAPVSEAHGVRGWIVRGIAGSAGVALTTAPLTAYHFHQVAAGGVIGNLVLTPLVELVALPLGLAGVLLGASPLIAAAAWLVGLADRGAGALAAVLPVGHVALASAALMAALVVISLWRAARPAAGRLAHERLRQLAWLALCAGWALGRAPPPPDALRVTFLDVGQGDAALLELPDGAVWLIDAGGNPGAAELLQGAATGRAIDRVLAAYDHARIDLAILSHPHPDHYLGLAGIAAPIDELWSADEGALAEPRGTRVAPGLPGFATIAAALAARGTKLQHPPLGLARRQGGVELTVWAPRYQAAPHAPPRCAADPVRTVNDNSLVVSVHYAGRTLLFAGDVEAEGEDELVAAGLGGVDVVKVAHHGSPTSSSERFVAATRPRLAVISCGPANRFGFPAAAVVERWRAAGAEVARTDTRGAITVTIDDTGRLGVAHFDP